MNKQTRLFVGLFLLSSMSVSSFRADVKGLKDSDLFKKFCSSYVGSITLGGGIGVVTGSVIKYVEDEVQKYLVNKWGGNEALALGLMLFGWALESELRHDIVLGLQGDLDQYDITYRKMLMLRTAWLASWIAYLG